MSLPTQIPPDLDALRGEIDSLDEQILILMECRLALARKIAIAKQAAPSAILIRPDREEQVIDRLSSISIMPRGSLATVWRELMALSLQTQRRTDIVIHAPSDPVGTTARSAARFGAAAPMIAVDSVEAALARAYAGSVVAVIELSKDDPWWLALDRADRLAVIDQIKGPGGKPSALALARVSETHLARARRWEVMDERELNERLHYGETLCPLACSHGKVLCIIEDVAVLLKGAA